MNNGINNLFKSSSAEGTSGSLLEYISSFVILILLTYFIQRLYEKKGQTIGDKKYFGSFFMIWSVSIFLIISVIKSSVVLSLGMVGALSIVRFRNAIKDTEQIMYLLFLIAISIALASNQYLYTFVVFGFTILIIYFRDFNKKRKLNSQFIYIKFNPSETIPLDEIILKLTNRQNQIVSIEKFGDNYEITATFNDYLQDEINEVCTWLTDENLSFRINQNFLF